MVMTGNIPDKGDIVYLNFSPQSGHEQAGHRPAIVLSPKAFNAGNFIAVCPITSKIKEYPFEVLIPSGLKVKGAILTDQLRTMDWRSRQLKFICKAPNQIVQECMNHISLYLKEFRELS